MIRKIIKTRFSRNVDKNICTWYLIKICIGKVISLFRGIIRCKKKVYLDSHVRLVENKKIKWGKSCRCSKDVVINALSQNGVVFGDFCSIGINTRIECTGSIEYLGKGFICGNNCGLGTDSFYGCAGGIEIGNDVIVGNFVSMHSENHNYSDLSTPIRLQGVNHKGIKIGDNCWIGAKATILDGTVLGTGCIVAAGAVVTGQFPNNVVIGGVPAKILKQRI